MNKITQTMSEELRLIELNIKTTYFLQMVRYYYYFLDLQWVVPQYQGSWYYYINSLYSPTISIAVLVVTVVFAVHIDIIATLYRIDTITITKYITSIRYIKALVTSLIFRTGYFTKFIQKINYILTIRITL